MRSLARRSVWAVLLVLAIGGIGCGEKGEQVNETAVAEFDWLTESQQALQSLRQELADLRAQAEAQASEGEEGEAASEGEEGEAATEGEGEMSLEKQIREAEGKVLELSEEFNQRIAGFFNEIEPMLEGEEPNERQAAVLRMKSAEDMVIAAEYIERGGDYRRAIRIYQDAMALDPDNPDLQAALARAEEMRFMTRERLAEVKNGMTQPEVKKLLGPVNLRNVRDYPERNVVAWFYPVDESGKASAVWFRKNRSGELAVYKTEFEQIKGRDESGEEIE